jgi:hypothetical protein
MCFPLRHGLSNCSVFSFVPYSCLFSRICAAYVDMELLYLTYLMCSLNLMLFSLPDCPTYNLLQVLHFNLYIPLGSVCLCLAVFSCCCIVLVARKLIFTLVCLNKLVIRLTSGLWYVKVTHLYRCVFISCCVWDCLCFCFFLFIVFVFKSVSILIGNLLFFAIAIIVYHSFCFEFSVIGIVVILFM